MHAAVADSLQRFTPSRSDAFFYLTDDDRGGSGPSWQPVVSSEATIRSIINARFPGAEISYGPFVNSKLPKIPKACLISKALRAVHYGYMNGTNEADNLRRAAGSKLYVWWATWEKIHRAYEMVIAHERSFDIKYDWMVRLRADLWLFGPLMPVSLCSLAADKIVVPMSVTNCLNDHLALVPRPLASLYFEGALDLLRCSGNSMDRSMNLWWRLRGRFVTTRMPYTLARPCSEASREASRMGSSTNVLSVAPDCFRFRWALAAPCPSSDDDLSPLKYNWSAVERVEQHDAYQHCVAAWQVVRDLAGMQHTTCSARVHVNVSAKASVWLFDQAV